MIATEKEMAGMDAPMQVQDMQYKQVKDGRRLQRISKNIDERCIGLEWNYVQN